MRNAFTLFFTRIYGETFGKTWMLMALSLRGEYETAVAFLQYCLQKAEQNHYNPHEIRSSRRFELICSVYDSDILFYI